MSSKSVTQASGEKLDIFNVKQEVCNADQLNHTALIQNDKSCNTNMISKDKESDANSKDSDNNQRIGVKASLREANLTVSPRRSLGLSPRRELAKHKTTMPKVSDEDSEGPSDIRIEKDKIVIKINLKNLKKKRKKSKRKKYKSKKSQSHDLLKKSKKVSMVSVNIENSVNYSISDPSDRSSTNSIDNSVDAVSFIAETKAISTAPQSVDPIDDGLIRINSGLVLQNKYSLRNPARHQDINSQLSQKILELTHQTLHMNYNNSLLSTNKPTEMNKPYHISCTSTSQMNSEPNVQTQMISSKARFAKFQNCQSIREILEQSSVDYRVNTTRQKYLDKFNNNFHVQCNLNQSLGDEYVVDLTHEPEPVADDEFMDINELKAFIPYETYLKQISEGSNATKVKPKAIENPNRAAKAPVPNLIRIDKNMCEIRDIIPSSSKLNHHLPNEKLLSNNMIEKNDVLSNEANKPLSSPLLRSQTKQKTFHCVSSEKHDSLLQADSSPIKNSASMIASSLIVDFSSKKSISDKNGAIVLRSCEKTDVQVQVKNNTAQLEFVVPSTEAISPTEKLSSGKSNSRGLNEKPKVTSNDSSPGRNPKISIDGHVESNKSVGTLASTEVPTDALQIEQSPIKTSLRSFRKKENGEISGEYTPTEDENQGNSYLNLDKSGEETSSVKLPQQSILNKTSLTKTTTVPTLSSIDSKNNEKIVEEEIDRISPIMLSQIIKKMQLEADLRHEQQCSSKDLSEINTSLGSRKELKNSLNNVSNQVHGIDLTKEISNERAICGDNSGADKRDNGPAKPTPESSTQETLFEALNLFKDQNHLPRRKIRKQTEINNLLEELEKLDSNEQKVVGTNEETSRLTQPLGNTVENQSDKTIDHIVKFFGNMMKDTKKPTSNFKNEPKINPNLVQALALSVNACENNLRETDNLYSDKPSEEHEVSKNAGELMEGTDSNAVLKTRKSHRIRKVKETSVEVTDNDLEEHKNVSTNNRPTDKRYTINTAETDNEEVSSEVVKDTEKAPSSSDNGSADNLRQAIKHIDKLSDLVNPQRVGCEDELGLTGILRKSHRIQKLKESPIVPISKDHCDDMEVYDNIKASNEPAEVEKIKYTAQNNNNNNKEIATEKAKGLDQAIALSVNDGNDKLKKSCEISNEITEGLGANNKCGDLLQSRPDATDVLKTRKSNRIQKLKELPTVKMSEIPSNNLKHCENFTLNDGLVEKNDSINIAPKENKKEFSIENSIDLDKAPAPPVNDSENNLKLAINFVDKSFKELEVLRMRKSDRIQKLKELHPVATNKIIVCELNNLESSSLNIGSAEQEYMNLDQNENKPEDDTAKDLTVNKVSYGSNLFKSNDTVSEKKANCDVNEINKTIITESNLIESKKFPPEELDHDINSSLENDILNINKTVVTELNNDTAHTSPPNAVKISSMNHVIVTKHVIPENIKSKMELHFKVGRNPLERKSKITRKCAKKSFNDFSKYNKKKSKRHTTKIKNNEVGNSSKNKRYTRKSRQHSAVNRSSDILEDKKIKCDLIEKMEKLNLKSNDLLAESPCDVNSKTEDPKVNPVERYVNDDSTQNDQENNVDEKTTKKKRKTKKIKHISIAKVSTKYELKKRRKMGSNYVKTVNKNSTTQEVLSASSHLVFEESFLKYTNDASISASLENLADCFPKDKRSNEKIQKPTVAAVLSIPATLPVIETLKRSTRRASATSICPTQSELSNFLPPSMKLMEINKYRLRQSVRSSVESTAKTNKMKCIEQSKQNITVANEKSKMTTTKKIIPGKQKAIHKGKILKKKAIKRSLRLRGLRKRGVSVEDTKKYCIKSQIITKQKCLKPEFELNNNEIPPVASISLEKSTTKTGKKGRKRKVEKDTIKIKKSGEPENKVKKHDLTKINHKLLPVNKTSSTSSKQSIQSKNREVVKSKNGPVVQKKLRQSIRLQGRPNLRKKNKKNVGAKSRGNEMVNNEKNTVRKSKKVQKLIKLKPTNIMETNVNRNKNKKSHKMLKSFSKSKNLESQIKQERIAMPLPIKNETVIDIHNVIGQIILKKKSNKSKISNTRHKQKEKVLKNKQFEEHINCLPSENNGNKIRRSRNPKVTSKESKLEIVEKNIAATIDVYDFQDDLETETPPVKKQCKLEPGKTDTLSQDEVTSLVKQNIQQFNSEILKETSDEINTEIAVRKEQTPSEYVAPITKERVNQNIPNQITTQIIESNEANIPTGKKLREPTKIVSKKDRQLYNIIQNIKTELREKLIKTEVTKTVHTNTEKLCSTESNKSTPQETNLMLDDPSRAPSTPAVTRKSTEIREGFQEKQNDIPPVAVSKASEPTAGEFNAELLNSIKIKKEQLKYYESHRPQAQSEDGEDVKDVKSVLLTCPLCEKIYRSQFRLKQHLRKRHVGQVFDCDCCREYFVDKNAFDEHMRSHDEGIVCRHCGDKFPKPAIREHLMSHIKEDQRDTVSDACFNKKQTSLLTHYLKKHGFKLQCTRCTDTFCPRSNILRHYLTKHSSEKIFYSCHRCEKRFSMLQNLKRHLAIHEGITYACNVCDRTYSRLSDFKIHQRMHTGLKFQCPVCLKCASRASYLKKHMIMIHGRVS